MMVNMPMPLLRFLYIMTEWWWICPCLYWDYITLWQDDGEHAHAFISPAVPSARAFQKPTRLSASALTLRVGGGGRVESL